MVPVLLTTDRRRGPRAPARAHRSGARSPWSSAAAVPFVARWSGSCCWPGWSGVITVAPPGPVAAGAIPLGSGGRGAAGRDGGRRCWPGRPAVLVLASAAADADAHVAAGRGRAWAARRAAPALLVVMCVVTLRASGSATRSPRRCWCRRCTCGCGRSTPDMRVPVPAARWCSSRSGSRRRCWSSATTPTSCGSAPIGRRLGGGAAPRRARRSSLVAALEWSVVLGCLLTAVTLSLLAARGSRAVPRSAGHRARPGHLRRPGLARRHEVGAAPLDTTDGRRVVTFPMRRLIRDLSSVLILSGLLLAARRRRRRCLAGAGDRGDRR